MNQFRGYDESAELLDHYFGEKRQSMQAAAAISLLFYVFFLLLTLFFLQPRRSRLRVLRETPVSRGAVSFLAQDAAGALLGGESDEESEFESEGWRISRRYRRKDSSFSPVESKRNEEGPRYNPKENRGRGEGGSGSEKVESLFLFFF